MLPTSAQTPIISNSISFSFGFHWNWYKIKTSTTKHSYQFMRTELTSHIEYRLCMYQLFLLTKEMNYYETINKVVVDGLSIYI